MAGKFGAPKPHTEVPRTTLVTALKDETDFFSTQALVQEDHTLKQLIEFTF
jgi:hypothetical protein